MITMKFKSLALKLSLLAAVAMTSVADAGTAYFSNYETKTADVVAGFRKTGSVSLQYEMVVYLGDITNFLTVPAGTTITITNYTTAQLNTLCGNNLNNLQWSVFAASEAAQDPATFSTTLGNFPANTSWYTIPRSNPSVQSATPARLSVNAAQTLTGPIGTVTTGAADISASLSASGTNSAYVLSEPVNSGVDSSGATLDANINDVNTPPLADFGGQAFTYTVENTTPASFTTAVASDFYQNCPYGEADPITGLSSVNPSLHVGYFTLNPSGTLTFTRSAPNPVLTAATTSANNGFGPLMVTLGCTVYGTITNYVWNFGNGIFITNSTPTVTYTYPKGGTTYTAHVTVYGPGGSSTFTVGAISPATPVTAAISGTNLVLSGTKGPVGAQYHFITATNLLTPLSSWKGVGTNTVPAGGAFGYTNSTTNTSAFFILVSP